MQTLRRRMLVVFGLFLGFSAPGWAQHPALPTTNNAALKAARQQMGASFTQHMGQGWTFNAETCELKHSQASAVTTVWMRRARGIFSANGTGALLACEANACFVGKASVPQVQLFGYEEESWRTTRAAHLGFKLGALCDLGAQATAEHIRFASETNGSGSNRFVLTKRSQRFGALRARAPVHMQNFDPKTCNVTGFLADGAAVVVPVTRMQLRPPTQTPNGRGVNMECVNNQSCVVVKNGAARKQATWLVAGTTAQQDAFVQDLIDLQKLCSFDDELPPVIN